MSTKPPLLRYQTQQGQVVLLGDKLGAGGEGDIFAVQGQPDWAAKVYAPKNRTQERAEKLRYMAAHPPADPFAGQHITFAWPFDLLYDAQKQFVGFLMPKLEVRQTALLFQIYHPAEARKRGLSWRFRMAVGHNLATVLEELHTKGYTVGDLNESNFLVHRDGLVTLVDCDSIQVQGEGGKIFHCRVQKPEFTPPELQGQSYADVTLKPQHDGFALAILIFHLLMEGRHPFAGRGIQTPDEGIRLGKSVLRGLEPIVGTPHPNTLPPSIRRLFFRAFGANQKQRPNALEWKQTLQNEFTRTQQCKRVPQHWYGAHLKGCPWCDPIVAKASVDLQSRLEPLLQNAADGRHKVGQWLLEALPLGLLLGIFLGLFRQALALQGMTEPQSLESLYHFPVKLSVHTLMGNIQIAVVPFFAAGLAIFVGWISGGNYRLWLSLLALLALPYFALPNLLPLLPTLSKPLWYLPVALHYLFLLPAQITLAGLALPGLLLIGAMDFYASTLSHLGILLSVGWVGLGLLMGMGLKLFQSIAKKPRDPLV